MLFAVEDSGIGIEAADHERIFQDFAQVDGPLQGRVKGTGLGLPLSRKLAQLLGGEIRIESVPGDGSTFTLDIPLQYTAAGEAPAAAISEEGATGTPILVVETLPDRMYSPWLEGSKFRLVRAATARDAEQAIAIEKPAAILLDTVPEGEDPWNLLASLKGAEETRGIPVIVISTVENCRKAFHLGANEYLLKPLTQGTLLDALRRVTGVGPRRVLIIDDDEGDRYILKHRLRGSRLAISEASNGHEGIAKAIAEHPQLIFLDLSMPEMNGMEVLQALKSDPRTATIAVVIHTSMKMDMLGPVALESGASAILSKEQLSQEDCIATLASRLGETGRILAQEA
ncbi:MAG TPA: response regulator, partial [Bryobacteraceae bacterium]|jgi:CheY-like chemotaxis protein